MAQNNLAVLPHPQFPQVTQLIDIVDQIFRARHLSFVEVDPRAPLAQNDDERCPSMSLLRPECRCLLLAGHVKLGFLYCQFNAGAETEAAR